jgi:hypothetical protein
MPLAVVELYGSTADNMAHCTNLLCRLSGLPSTQGEDALLLAVSASSPRLRSLRVQHGLPCTEPWLEPPGLGRGATLS